MRPAALIAILLTVVLVVATGVVTAVVGYMVMAVALNGFVGNAHAIKVAMGVYFAGTILSTVVAAVMAAIATRRRAVKRERNAAGAAVLSTLAFGFLTGVAHFVVLIGSILVAVLLYSR